MILFRTWLFFSSKCNVFSYQRCGMSVLQQCIVVVLGMRSEYCIPSIAYFGIVLVLGTSEWCQSGIGYARWAVLGEWSSIRKRQPSVGSRVSDNWPCPATQSGSFASFSFESTKYQVFHLKIPSTNNLILKCQVTSIWIESIKNKEHTVWFS